MTTYRTREMALPVREALKQMPAVALTGMRQTGKTTLLQQDPALKDRRYVTFDDFAQLEAARENPESLLAGDEPLTIDEAQKCPELFTELKKEIDRKRRPGRFLLSGSANLLLLRTLSESLAGRAVYLHLRPLHRREILGQTDRPPFLPAFFKSAADPAVASRFRPGTSPAPVTPAEILRGGMPSISLGEVEDAPLWLRGFEQTYLERDVRSLAQVADLVAFRRLMQMAALRTGQILNQSQIGRDAGLSAMTAGRYLDLLETSFVITRLPPFLGNRTSRLIKSPKLLFTDTGLAASLAGVKNLDPAADEPMRGALLETYVAQNLSAILEAHWPDARLHFWSVQGRYEVDFVIEDGRDSIAIEVKAASHWGAADLAPLEAFLAATKRCRAGILAHNGRDAVQLRDRLWALPIAHVLS
ncbi:MAG TPA: ATP-binding protein [Planctomycetota bacterium]|nr:ATP-binding protein [Planctomycetota bacterium]